MAPDDIANVAGWLRCRVAEVQLRLEKLPIERFASIINACLASYDDFPEDRVRMQRIAELLKSGADRFPVFVKDGDEDLSVIEGRHRLVTFFLRGVKEIDVAFVSAARPRLTLRR